MKKFLFLLMVSLMCVNGYAQVPNGPTTPVPPIPTGPLFVEPIVPVVPQGPVIDLPFLPPINLPNLPNFIPPFLVPNLPLVPVPDPIGNEPLILTQSYCNSLTNQINAVELELMLLYMQFNIKRTAISVTKDEIKLVNEEIDKLTSEGIVLSLQNMPVPIDLRNHIENRVSWKVWLMQRINKIEAEIVPIEKQIDYWEPILLDLKDRLSKAGC